MTNLIIFSRQLTVPKTAENLIEIIPLSDNYGLLTEQIKEAENAEEVEDGPCMITLVWLDFRGKAFQKLFTVELYCEELKIIVNKADPTEFFVRAYSYHSSETIVRVGKVNEKKLIIADKVLVDSDIKFEAYYNGCLYSPILIENHEVCYSFLLFSFIFHSRCQICAFIAWNSEFSRLFISTFSSILELMR